MTKEEFKKYQDFANDLRQLCEKHKVFILPTCYNEGIFGEITIGEIGKEHYTGWEYQPLKFKIEDDYRGIILT